MSYVETLNIMGWNLNDKLKFEENRDENIEFCLVNNCENVLRVANEFVSDILPH
jgi:hypothetical protein